MIRTRVNEVRETGRDTMGVQLINLGKRDAVVGIARNAEAEDDAEAAGLRASRSRARNEQCAGSGRTQSDIAAEGEQPAAGEPEE